METIGGITSDLGMPINEMDGNAMNGFSDAVNNVFNNPKTKEMISGLFGSIENTKEPGEILSKLVGSFSDPNFTNSLVESANLSQPKAKATETERKTDKEKEAVIESENSTQSLDDDEIPIDSDED